MSRSEKTTSDDPFHWTEIDAGALEGTSLANALTQWRAAAADGATAPRFSVDFLMGLPARLYSYANVVEVAGDGPPFPFRFFGTALADLHTFELTGKTTDAITPAGFRQLCVDQYLLVVAAGRPRAFSNIIPTRTRDLLRRHTMLRLPFSDDGERVTQVLTVEETEKLPEGEAPYTLVDARP